MTTAINEKPAATPAHATPAHLSGGPIEVLPLTAIIGAELRNVRLAEASRSADLGTLTLVNNLIGLAAGPVVTGLLADRLGLSAALAVAPLVSALAITALFIGRRTYASSVRRALAVNKWAAAGQCRGSACGSTTRARQRGLDNADSTTWDCRHGITE